MDNLDTYFEALDELSDYCVRSGCSVLDLVQGADESVSPIVTESIDTRTVLVDAADIEKYQGYLAIGLFHGYDETKRIACWAFACELGQIVR